MKVFSGLRPLFVLFILLKSLAINTAGGVIAGEIGKAYKGGYGTIDPLTHKLFHGLLGGGMGALLGNNPTQDAITGALSAMVAESVAEVITEQPDHALARMIQE